MAMDKTIKELWCTKLESGEIPQAKGVLFGHISGTNTAGMCCLGVLMAVQGHDFRKQIADYEGDGNGGTRHLFEESEVPTQYAAGLTTGEQQELANLNDGTTGEIFDGPNGEGRKVNPECERLKFPEMAKLIRERF